MVRNAEHAAGDCRVVASNASRGAAAKAKTKKWLIARGYQVADLEVVRWIRRPEGRMPVKHDQLGADLLAMNAEKIVLIQVKSGLQCIGNGQFPQARREFAKFTFPPFVKCFIVAWAPRARAPRLIDGTPNYG